jgi:hypothetical protein
MMEAKAMTKHRRRRSLDTRIMDALGNEWCGNTCPPLANRQTYVHDDGVTRVFSMMDDGGFVGIGYPDEWHVIMRTKAARLFAWWTFKTWAAGWFGLREFIWYRALHHKCHGKWRAPSFKHPTTVWTITPEEAHAERCPVEA